jgi:Dyp-type peroxidase family
MAGGGAPGLPLRNGLSSDDIQGDILAGFSKDYRMYFFLKFPNQPKGRAWLKELTRQKLIASTRTVAAFNERFSAARTATGGNDPDIKAVWLGVSITFAGLQLLAQDAKQLATDLQSYAAFINGPVGNLQNNDVRDTTKADALGDAGTFSGPRTWLFGGIDEQGHDKNTIHALLNVQADDPDELTVELEKMRTLAAEYAVEIVYEQRGATLSGERAGHEHFGFKDGISQPGVDSFDVRDNANDDDPSDRLGQVAGHPGTAIIAAGEFILGENPEPPPVFPPLREPATLDTNKLGWMKNGSFQVFRRLEQDVPAFWGQITKNAHSLPSDDPMLAELLAAKIVGRWRSGTPLDLAPERDDRFTHDPVDDNNFHFFEKDADGNVLKDKQGNPLDDEKGLRCPRFAHIRKVYPRANNAFTSRHRRIMRRGVPFGLPFDPANGTGHGADADRGLLFVAYMRSIADQFEFLQQQWVNNTQFPFGVPPTNLTINGELVTASGPDPIIGTSSTRADDVLTGVPRTVTDEQNAVLLRRDADTLLNFQRFVHTTGSLYTFVPSISTLARLANGEV